MPENIVSAARALSVEAIIKRLPNSLCCRICRGILRIVCRTLASYSLAKSYERSHYFLDTAPTCQVSVTGLFIKAKTNGLIRNADFS